MNFLNKVIYNFLQQKCLASLLLSKHSIFFCDFFDKELSVYDLKYGLQKIKFSINTIKTYDINLLIINALWFLLFGIYPKSLIQKKFIKYRKSKVHFLLSFSKKNTLCFFLKIFYYIFARQSNLIGYYYKTNYFVGSLNQCFLSIKSNNVLLFYMVDFLYSQEIKSIITVRQKVTINLNCCFNGLNIHRNRNYLDLLLYPFFFDLKRNTKKFLLSTL